LGTNGSMYSSPTLITSEARWKSAQVKADDVGRRQSEQTETLPATPDVAQNVSDEAAYTGRTRHLSSVFCGSLLWRYIRSKPLAAPFCITDSR
jgi:hypothetical protein